MEISQIYSAVLEAAKNIGPVGTATAVLTGAASAAGKTAFDSLKSWFVKKFGGDAEITQQLTALQANPGDTAVQDNFRAHLTQHAAQLQDAELVKIVQTLQQNFSITYNQSITVSGNSSGINVSQQNGEIKNVTVNNGYSAVDVARLVADAVKSADSRADTRHKSDAEIINNLTTAVTALSQSQTRAKPFEIQKAFEALRQGDFSQALTLFEEDALCFEEEAKKGAKIQRNIGALAFFNDTQKSLKAYRRATQLDPENTGGWNQLGHLLRRVGQWDEAIHAYKMVFRLGQEHQNKAEVAAAYSSLGNMCRTRGNLDKAIGYYNQALQIFEILGNQEGMAIQYGSLGNVYRTRGDSGKAVEYYNQALQIFEILGNQEGMATQYGNLGIVSRIQGYLDKSIDYHNKALKTHEILSSKTGIANQYSNLGDVCLIQLDLDKAVEYYNQALKIHEILGYQEGMAIQYGSLGNVCKIREDMDEAVAYYNKALKIHEILGLQEGIASQYGNLGNVYKTRRNFDKAVEYYKKALKIHEIIGYQEGMANSYGNLGIVCQIQGDLDKSRDYWQKSLALFKAVGSPNAKTVQRSLDELSQP